MDITLTLLYIYMLMLCDAKFRSCGLISGIIIFVSVLIEDRLYQTILRVLLLPYFKRIVPTRVTCFPLLR